MTKRNYGIDFLRILSMLMIVILHVLGRGGILSNAALFSADYWAASFLKVITYCAVNCFAIISGYVMINSTPKVSRILGLWLQIFFYTALLTGIQYIIYPESTSLSGIITAVFPVTRQYYWYITSYFGVYLLSPLLNSTIKNTDKKTMDVILITAFILFSILPTVLNSDPFILNNGYSLIWLCLLYLIGGYVRINKIADRIKRRYSWIVFAAMIILTFASKFVLSYLTNRILGKPMFDDILICYTSPTIVLAGVSLFLACVKQTFPNTVNKIISVFAPAALGVYLIHASYPVWDYVLNGFAKDFLNFNFIIVILLVILSSVVIYILCSVIELLRIKLFAILGVTKLCGIAENFLVKRFNKIYSRHNNEKA